MRLREASTTRHTVPANEWVAVPTRHGVYYSRHTMKIFPKKKMILALLSRKFTMKVSSVMCIRAHQVKILSYKQRGRDRCNLPAAADDCHL